MSSNVPRYAELHAHSYYSFLDGVNDPADLVIQAQEYGLSAVGLTDHNGFYGVMPFLQQSKLTHLPVVVGAEVTLASQTGRRNDPDPQGEHLVILARNVTGYHELSHLLTQGHLEAGQKDRVSFSLEQLAQVNTGNWQILTGCRKGRLRSRFEPRLGEFSAAAGKRVLSELVDLFGADNIAVELTAEADAHDARRQAGLAALAAEHRLRSVVTGNVHSVRAADLPLAHAVAAIRSNKTLDEIAPWLPPLGRFLRTPLEMAQLHPNQLEALEMSVIIAQECAFDEAMIAPKLPHFPIPPGHTDDTWLRAETYRHAHRRYGPPSAENRQAYELIDHELGLIQKLGFAGYFLIVYDIVQFCNREGILCQGRGSAANSVVCYCLGITAVDAARHQLLFERFLAEGRQEPPDIDIDIESVRREEVIQYVYRRYGRHRAAMVANLITYRSKSALRDAARVLGYDDQTINRWAKERQRGGTAVQIPDRVKDLAEQLRGLPQHLGIHPGGIVLTQEPVSQTCPIEWARAEGRTVLQWDKESCADAGLVKFDLLSLGMLSAIKYAFGWIREFHGVELDLHSLPEDDPAVYNLLCEADTIGVFQVESRAQMATLPRLRPRKFYDIVVEVALIRPGPIQGGSVHPYINRARGREAVTYPHPLLKPVLERTLGVPLFQEQLMQVAMVAASFTPEQADRLRRALGSKHAQSRLEKIRAELYAGMAANGIDTPSQDLIYSQLQAFSDFGFPESHSFSFAYLAYASAWLKVHYPHAFYAGLLAAQPMGFYSPATLVADAQRHDVLVLPVDVRFSDVKACVARANEEYAVRLGLNQVRDIGDDVAERIVTQRAIDTFSSVADLAQRARLTSNQLHQLALSGALDGLGESRRKVLWQSRHTVGKVSPQRRHQQLSLPLFEQDADHPLLPELTASEVVQADLQATGVSLETHPMMLLRSDLQQQGVLTVQQVRALASPTRISVAGFITHRQRPATAAGVTFLSLEDETGLLNIVCSMGFWQRYRTILATNQSVIIRGLCESADGAMNLVADAVSPLSATVPWVSRDFQ